MSNSTPRSVFGGDAWTLLETVVDGPLHPGGRAASERLLDRASVVAGTVVIDVGCGAGETLAIAGDRGAETIGMDSRVTDGVDIQGTLGALPIRDAGVTVVTAECVLCLATDLDGTLREIHRILEPGGRLAMSDVFVPGSRPDLTAALQHLLCLEGVRDPVVFEETIRSAGFRLESVETHSEELLAMRDRLEEALDLDRLQALLNLDLAGGDLGAVRKAVETGEVEYRSIVAVRE